MALMSVTVTASCTPARGRSRRPRKMNAGLPSGNPPGSGPTYGGMSAVRKRASASLPVSPVRSVPSRGPKTSSRRPSRSFSTRAFGPSPRLASGTPSHADDSSIASCPPAGQLSSTAACWSSPRTRRPPSGPSRAARPPTNGSVTWSMRRRPLGIKGDSMQRGARLRRAHRAELLPRQSVAVTERDQRPATQRSQLRRLAGEPRPFHRRTATGRMFGLASCRGSVTTSSSVPSASMSTART